MPIGGHAGFAGVAVLRPQPPIVQPGPNGPEPAAAV
jgi:hypothetical protein